MQTIIYAITGYFLMLLTVRVLSRRPGAQMTPFEFVLVFLIGGVLILCIMDDDRSQTNSVTAVITVGLMHRAVARLKYRFPVIGKVVDGTPIMLVQEGQFRTDMMSHARLHEMDVMASAR